MFDQLKQNLLRRASFSHADLERICATVEVRQVKRKRNVLSMGNIPRFVLYVNKGLARMYTMEGTEERTFEFGAEDEWLADLGAFREKSATRVNIETIEDSELFLIHYDDAQRLHTEIPLMERFSRFHAEEKYIDALERLQKINHANYSAEMRYLAFARTYPSKVGRIPSTHLASYLGIAAETLSRIRKNLLMNERK